MYLGLIKNIFKSGIFPYSIKSFWIFYEYKMKIKNQFKIYNMNSLFKESFHGIREKFKPKIQIQKKNNPGNIIRESMKYNSVSDLQKSNDFLFNVLKNINFNPFFGFKVDIKKHWVVLNGYTIEETHAVIYNIDTYNNNIWVLYKNKQTKKIVLESFNSEHILLKDRRFTTYL